MKFSEFKNACGSMLRRLGSEEFKKAGLKLHDVDASSQFVQAVRPAGVVMKSGNSVQIGAGRSPLTLAQTLLRVADMCADIGGDPEVTVGSDPKFVLGYDSQQKCAVASYDLPPPDDDMSESILDRPKAGMDPAVWKETGGKPVLSDGAQAVVDGVTEWAKDGWIGAGAGVHVIGSIASNSYSDDSDVDVHFYGDELDFGGKDPEEFNREFRKAFAEFAASRPDLSAVGTHPVEVYAQPNEFQDMMSVGCYDAAAKTWEAGPEIKDTAFDPYSEYYEEDMEYVDGVIGEVRDAVLSLYEKCVVLAKASDEGFRKKLGDGLMSQAKKVAALFKRLKKMRKAVSQPKSKEDALEKRADRKWHVADSAFKLLDKFGYMDVCWTCQDVVEKGEDAETARKRIAAAVRDSLASNANLTDSERRKYAGTLLDEGDLDESLRGTVTAAAVVALMALPGVLPKTAFAAELKDVPVQRLTVDSLAVKKAVAAASAASYGGLNSTNIVNAIARTIFAEAGDESKEGRDAVASVIWNRAGGKAANLVPVVSKPLHFSCWNKYTGGWKDSDYKYRIPARTFSDKNAKAVWDECVDLAARLFREEFTSTIGNRNSYMNKAKADKKNVDGWGSKLDLKIGKHDFGYLPDNDGFKTRAKGAEKGAEKGGEYIVKPGDTLGKIAKKYKTTAAEIARKNGIKDPDKIRAGQRLRV